MRAAPHSVKGTRMISKRRQSDGQFDEVDGGAGGGGSAVAPCQDVEVADGVVRLALI